MTSDKTKRPHQPRDEISVIPSPALLESMRVERQRKLLRGEKLEAWTPGSAMHVPPYCRECGDYLPAGRSRCPACHPGELEPGEWEERKLRAYQKDLESWRKAKRYIHIFFGVMTAVSLPTVLGPVLCAIAWFVVVKMFDGQEPDKGHY